MLIAIIQFLFAIALEVGAVLDLKFYKQHKRKEAVILAGLLGTLAGIASIIYNKYNVMLIPDVLGLMVGTWIIMTYIPWED